MSITLTTINKKLEELLRQTKTGGSPLASAIAAREIPQWAKLAERSLVQTAHNNGMSWREIGKDLGMSRQAAWEQYGQGNSDADEDTETNEKTKRRPAPVIRLALTEAEILHGILEDKLPDDRAASALGQALQERITELLAAMNGDDTAPEDRPGTLPQATKPATKTQPASEDQANGPRTHPTRTQPQGAPRRTPPQRPPKQPTTRPASTAHGEPGNRGPTDTGGNQKERPSPPRPQKSSRGTSEGTPPPSVPAPASPKADTQGHQTAP
jgi:hypothetical protein